MCSNADGFISINIRRIPGAFHLEDAAHLAAGEEGEGFFGGSPS
jgi:hypothetical protein